MSAPQAVAVPAGDPVAGWRRSPRRALWAATAFFRMGWLTAAAYPMSFAISQATTIVPLVVYYFISRIVGTGHGQVGGDYFTFIVIGVASQRLLTGGMAGLGEEIESSIREGRLETLLVQPVDWRVLPLGLAEWPIAWGLINAVALFAISVGLGAHYRAAGFAGLVALVVLGVTATLAVGIVAGALKVLAKRTDPLLTVYGLAAAILSGAFYPLTLLPSGLRALSWAVPDTYLISGARHLLMARGTQVAGPGPWTAVVALAVFDVAAVPFALWLFRRALEYGRAAGVLAGY